MVRLNARRRKAAAAAVEPVALTDLTIQASPYQIDLSGSLRTDYGRLQAGLFAVCAALHPGAQKTLAVVSICISPPPSRPLHLHCSVTGTPRRALLNSEHRCNSQMVHVPAAGRRTDVSRV